MGAANPSQVDVPRLRLDRQPAKFDFAQGGGRKSCDDSAATYGALKPIKFIGADDDNGVFPVKRNALRPSLLRLPDDLAKASLCILQPPSSRRGAGGESCRSLFGPGHVFNLSSHRDQKYRGMPCEAASNGRFNGGFKIKYAGVGST